MKFNTNLINILIIGSYSPLQKLLPNFFKEKIINVSAVFLNINEDKASIKLCEQNSVLYYPIENLNNYVNEIKKFNIDWIFNINSTIIINKIILDLPSRGSLNFHPGLLPKYAGLHTHQWAIRNDEKEFGVTLHWIDEGIDTGDIAFQTKFKLTGKETGLSLYLKCLSEGVNLIRKCLKYIIENKNIPAIKQDFTKRKLYTDKMAKDGKINWNSYYKNLFNFLRAANYKPFKCPTYKPYTYLDNVKLIVENIELDILNKNVGIGNIFITSDNEILVGLRDFNAKVSFLFEDDFLQFNSSIYEFILKSSKKLN